MSSKFIYSVDLKLKRAEIQVQQLIASIAQWALANQITARCELRENRMGYRLILNEFSQPAPLNDWGLQTGELIHNLRSSLDNLAFALARLRKDPPDNPRKIAFPIFDDKQKFDKSFLLLRKYFPDDASDLIEIVQPFQRNGSEEDGFPHNDALAMIRHLNNEDKHRVPAVILVTPTESDWLTSVEFQNPEDAAANTPPDFTVSTDPLNAGMVLLEFRTKHPIASARGKLNCVAKVAIKTHQKAIHIDPGIPQLCLYTNIIIDQFRKFFI